MKGHRLFGWEKTSPVGCTYEGLHGVERDRSGLGGWGGKSSGGNDRNPYFNRERESRSSRENVASHRVNFPPLEACN